MIARVIQAPPPVLDQNAVAALVSLVEIIKSADKVKTRIDELRTAEDRATEAVTQAKELIEADAQKTLALVKMQSDAATEALVERAKVLDARQAALDAREQCIDKHETDTLLALDARSKVLDTCDKELAVASARLAEAGVLVAANAHAQDEREKNLNERIARLDALLIQINASKV